MRYRVVWRPKASAQLDSLYLWIADAAGPEIAYDYTSRIEAATNKLTDFPHRGTPRDDLAHGLRTIPYRRRTVIGYRVIGDTVEIVGLSHGGQDLSRAFGGDEN